jgi:indole-3-glycerol phosphate synthase
MADFLDILALDAKKSVMEGYYTVTAEDEHKFVSLKKSIIEFTRAPIITEIKLASPSLGTIREDAVVEDLASEMMAGGAVAISVLTEFKHFMGSLKLFIKVRKRVGLPLLMKDIILARAQIDAAYAIGADTILLIKALFDRGYCECSISNMIEYAHSKGIEVLLETHREDEFSSALETEADLVGINNRDLRTLKVDISTTRRILEKVDPKGRIIVSESGIKNSSDIPILRNAGAQAFLIGSVIMLAEDSKKKVREFVSAI